MIIIYRVGINFSLEWKVAVITGGMITGHNLLIDGGFTIK